MLSLRDGSAWLMLIGGERVSGVAVLLRHRDSAEDT